MTTKENIPGLVLKELRYKTEKGEVVPKISFTDIKKLRIKRNLLSSEIEIEFN